MPLFFQKKTCQTLEHDIIKDMSKNGANFALSIIANGKSEIKKGIAGLAISAMWTSFKSYRASHPTYKGIPQGAKITQ